ncbi:MAG: hypothetical protein ACREID_02835 [Planctomycetota bacterium]
MPGEDPALRKYRRFLLTLCVVAGLAAAVVGATMLARGRVFQAFLALCVVAYLLLLVRGYRQDERERNP